MSENGDGGSERSESRPIDVDLFRSTTYDISVTDPTNPSFYTSMTWPSKKLGLQCALDVSLFCHTLADDPPDSA